MGFPCSSMPWAQETALDTNETPSMLSRRDSGPDTAALSACRGGGVIPRGVLTVAEPWPGSPWLAQSLPQQTVNSYLDSNLNWVVFYKSLQLL